MTVDLIIVDLTLRVRSITRSVMTTIKTSPQAIPLQAGCDFWQFLVVIHLTRRGL